MWELQTLGGLEPAVESHGREILRGEARDAAGETMMARMGVSRSSHQETKKESDQGRTFAGATPPGEGIDSAVVNRPLIRDLFVYSHDRGRRVAFDALRLQRDEDIVEHRKGTLNIEHRSIQKL